MLDYERHRLWNSGEDKGEWLELVGAELRFSTDPLPLVRLPGVEFQLGMAQVLDEPLKDQTQWWIGTNFRL